MRNDSLDPSIKNIQTIVSLEQRALQNRRWIDRVTDTVTGAAASPAFVATHAAIVFAWVVVNVRTAQPFDPYPYNLLTLVLSVEAIFLTGFVLMSQDRMTRQADRRAHLDLQINLLAEQELTAILSMLTALCERAGLNAATSSVDQLAKETDVQKIAATLDRQLEEGNSKATE